MMRFIVDIIVPLVASCVTLFVAYILGQQVYHRIVKEKQEWAIEFGISSLVGYGVLAYTAMGVSFFGPLNQAWILSVYVFFLIVHRVTVYKLVTLPKWIAASFLSLDKLNKCIVALIFFASIFYVTSVFLPPYRTDALAYR